MVVKSNILHEADINFSNSKMEFEHISIDSRSLQNGNTTLFFCLKGQNNDAHIFIESLIEKGVQHFVVEYIPENVKGKAHFCLVENTTVALQNLAKAYKNQFQIETIGITGSNGKTIVKEWLNFLLSPDYSVVRSPKSFNSQVGVPLSIFGINENHTLGIFEAGISLKGEMQHLAEIIQPNIGIFTHLGNAHQEGFTTVEEKIIEKCQLFSKAEVLILEKNDWIEKHITIPTFTWSFEDNKATVFIQSILKNNLKTSLEIQYKNEIFEVSLPFTDAISIENAITCICTLLYLKVSISNIKERISKLYNIEIRLQAKKGINNCLLIDDSFSSDYQSLKIALDFLDQQKLHQKKTIILSDIFQSGLNLNELYSNVIKLLQQNNITQIITIGETIGKYFQDVPNVISFANTQAFLQQFNTDSFKNETILIKGARSFNFDEIVVLLEEKNHETVLEINLDALTFNYNFYKQKLENTTKIMVMVKAFGYGNGGYEIAKQLEHLKVSYLGVAFADEGIALRKAGITTPIMVLNPEISSYKAMIAYNLEPEMYSISGITSFIELAKEKNLNRYPIHLKIDTGMHRLGFEKSEVSELITLLQHNNFVKVTSIFSHLAASDNFDFKAFTLQQIEQFEAIAIEISTTLHIQPIRHILNTSGIFNFPEYQFEMVRLGIGIYGVGNSEEEQISLENVSVLKSIISQIRTVNENESIGYSRKFVVQKEMRIATIPIGYADGIRRAWGNEKGYVLINNRKATILGNICMDMLMVDVTFIPCEERDEVIIFGENPHVQEIASVCDTIPYEILTSISQRVKRIFYKN
ncbi:bifunctional UDP-N-acetylmuramoyl-tripeptide:D-alanyl-D-alanine ligase/alanine racemase [Flavobacterium sp.]|uniref:bifunctional UDP-N-acetylmuramoyl-tripeptide:D-alanyl-D-alanine ligase/alanine racemase n=1 Tax=Flavobacterium sp. TaxID=239 RepID=UPI001B4C2253|nr:bifunctional UDP-N-acetylmuramoyl-tripeptide:D-alanyl-D-alanine ligase/alanine racemase [Flavobacterium sp.]MBP6128327.1 bifunctional UDP-N-acetylmuramoyl-tripeptide:D-alanyl-D-alanine ligase/alanine racemase [Flavobacterium sp.]